VVRSVSQRPNLRHLFEPLGGTEGLLETAGLKKTTECVWWRTNKHEYEKGVSDWRGSYAETAGGKGVQTGGTNNRLVLEENRERAGLWYVRRARLFLPPPLCTCVCLCVQDCELGELRLTIDKLRNSPPLQLASSLSTGSPATNMAAAATGLFVCLSVCLSVGAVALASASVHQYLCYMG